MTVVEYTYHNDSVDSTAISQIWYNTNTKALFVEFQDSGTIAGYSNVPAEVVDELLDSSSIGRYYTQNIKNKYHGINTEDIEFREAFKPRRWTFDNNFLVDDTKPGFVPSLNAYEVTAVVPMTDTVAASSYDDAVAAFGQIHGADAEILSIRIVKN